MYPHRIRLRGPWDCQPIGMPNRHVTMPCRWSEIGLTDGKGPLQLVRKFGYPGRIDADEQVWLLGSSCCGCQQILLNDKLLNPADSPPISSAFAFEVTSLLLPRNQLRMTVQTDANITDPWGEVTLEIRKSAWLTDLRLHAIDLGVQLTGLAVGHADRPLELYTLIDGRHEDYRTIQPTADGLRFAIDLHAAGPFTQTIRVELIHVSAIWYVVEMPIRDWISG